MLNVAYRRAVESAVVMTISMVLFGSMAAAKPPPGIQKKLDSFVAGGPGGAALAWVDSNGVEFYQSGTLSSDDPRTITPDTQFELGSLTKIFTALLLVETERLGKVSRLDSAAKHLLPDKDPSNTSLTGITLLSLVTHTSGLPRLPSSFGKDKSNPQPYSAYDHAMLIDALRTDGPIAQQSQNPAYSNFGAAVLGEALAAAWKTTYAKALTEHVLIPLGLKETSVGVTGLPAPSNLAPGHLGNKVVQNWTFQAIAPAGALRSSSREMSRFVTICLGSKTEPLRGSIDLTFKKQYSAPNLGGDIGIGWILIDQGANSIAWHNGATAGSHSFLGLNRKTGQGVVILSNIQRECEGLGFSLIVESASASSTR